MIDVLRAALAAAGYEPTPEELADILWLAAQPHMGTLHNPHSAGPHPTGGRTAGGLPSVYGRGNTDQRTAGKDTDTRALYALADWTQAGSVAVSPTRVPTPKALPNSRGIAKSLRPLRSKTPSRTRSHLDITATVAALADGLRDIVLTPAHEPLLDLTFVVDDGISMAVWHDTAKELHQEFHRLKAFRRTRLLGMNTDDPDQVRFSAEPFRRNAPATQPVTGDRTLLLIFSDAVGQAWHSGQAQGHMLRWATKGPTAVFHVLPEDMWPGTGLPTLQLMASAARPALPNHHIRLRHPRLPRGILPVPTPPVPVIDVMRGTSITGWAQLVGAPAGETALHFYDPHQLSVDALSSPGEEDHEPSPESALEAFFAYASNTTRRLAAHLACAGTALTVPLMRLVQRSAVPESGPEHLAEVFLAGLLIPFQPVTADGADPLPHEALPWDRRSFAFPPTVAESLRELVRRSDERATHDYVTRYLTQQHRTAKAGTALISDAQGALRARTDLPLGNVGADGPRLRWTTAPGRQFTFAAMTERLNGLMDRMSAPRLDWVIDAVASRPATADMRRVADLLDQAAGQESLANDSGDYAQLKRILVALSRELQREDLAPMYEEAIDALRHRRTGPYFYLSYARVPVDSAGPDTSNPDLWVHRLFDELSRHVLSLTDLPNNVAPGFMTRLSPEAHSDSELSDSLANCRVFVPLYSPRYFISSWCGKEWAAFAQRRKHYRNDPDREAPSAVVPALWAPVPDHRLPEPARQLQYLIPEMGHRYRTFGLYGLAKLKAFRIDYQRAVFHLARSIVDVAQTVVVEPGERIDLATISDAFTPTPPGSPATGGQPSVREAREPSPDIPEAPARFRLDLPPREQSKQPPQDEP
ncbi:TIR-like protein FxsC [Streptomyces chartreusis]|uniref:TIR-like protein FxsC n=1 Tax=Streptomyces chartreusis TaxID=1969 RepID=UPI0036746AE0